MNTGVLYDYLLPLLPAAIGLLWLLALRLGPSRRSHVGKRVYPLVYVGLIAAILWFEYLIILYACKGGLALVFAIVSVVLSLPLLLYVVAAPSLSPWTHRLFRDDLLKGAALPELFDGATPEECAEAAAAARRALITLEEVGGEQNQEIAELKRWLEEASKNPTPDIVSKVWRAFYRVHGL